jgi:hypothetical protein
MLCCIPKLKAHQFVSETVVFGAGCPSINQENESGTCASTANAKKTARNVGEARYVNTNAIAAFVHNVMEHPFAGIKCRSPDAPCVNTVHVGKTNKFDYVLMHI